MRLFFSHACITDWHKCSENKLWDKIGENKCENRPEIEAPPIGGYYSVLFGALWKFMCCHKQKWSEVGQSLNGFGFVVTFCCNVCLPLSAKLDLFCTACLLIWDSFARHVCSAGSVFGTLSAHLGLFCTSSAHLRPTSTSRCQVDIDYC